MGEAEGRVRSRWERPYWPPSTGVPMRPPEYDRDFVKHLTDRLDAVLQWIEDTGCTCDGSFHYASLADHENACPAQVELILRGTDV